MNIKTPNFSNKINLSLLTKKNAKEVSELYKDIVDNTPYKNVKINIKDKNNVQLIGSKPNSTNSLTVDMDFAHNLQTQVEKTKSFFLTIIHPNRERTQEIRGTLDGVIKRAKTTTIEKNKDGTSFIKTTDYQNFISGNTFRQEVTPEGVKYYRNINGDFVEMFSKK